MAQIGCRTNSQSKGTFGALYDALTAMTLWLPDDRAERCHEFLR